ncbi:MAG TPA: DUF2786 domain-containing protein [Cellvibrionaceae bacterium]
MSDKNAAIEKIKKCLALAGSDNPHEAAAAMRQAKKLMALHGLEGVHDDFFTLAQERVTTKYRRTPLWFRRLGAVVARAFGCSFYWAFKQVIFIGPSSAPEIAGYCFEVALNNVEARKKLYLGKVAYVNAATKRSAGEYFCTGFVFGVFDVVNQFATGLSDEAAIAHRGYLERSSGFEVSARKKKAAVFKVNSASIAGFKNGKEVQLHQPVSSRQKAAVLELIGGGNV